jgi:hypothetical protein
MSIEKQKKYLAGKRRQSDCRLTLSDLQNLLAEANITIDDVGRHSHEYHLARYGDTGPYEIGNCRFITCAENQKERAYSPSPEVRKRTSDTLKGRSKSTEHRRKISEGLKRHTRSPEHIRKQADSQRGRKLSEEHKKKISLAMKNRSVS